MIRGQVFETTCLQSALATAVQIVAPSGDVRECGSTTKSPGDLTTWFGATMVDCAGENGGQEAQTMADYSNPGPLDIDIPSISNLIGRGLLTVILLWLVSYVCGALVRHKNVKVNYTRKIRHFTIFFSADIYPGTDTHKVRSV